MIMRIMYFVILVSASNICLSASRAFEVKNSAVIWQAFFDQAKEVAKVGLATGLFTEDDVDSREYSAISNPIAATLVQLLIRSRHHNDKLRLHNGGLIPYSLFLTAVDEDRLFKSVKDVKAKASKHIGNDSKKWAQLYYAVMIRFVPDEQIEAVSGNLAEDIKVKGPGVEEVRAGIFDVVRTLEGSSYFQNNFDKNTLEQVLKNKDWENNRYKDLASLIKDIEEDIDRPAFSKTEEAMFKVFLLRIRDEVSEKIGDRYKISPHYYRLTDWQRVSQGLVKILENNLYVGGREWMIEDGFQLDSQVDGVPSRINKDNCPGMFKVMYPALEEAMAAYKIVRLNGELDRGRPPRGKSEVVEDLYKYIDDYRDLGLIRKSWYGLMKKRYSPEVLWASLSYRRKLYFLMFRLSNELLTFPHIVSGLRQLDNQ